MEQKTNSRCNADKSREALSIRMYTVRGTGSPCKRKGEVKRINFVYKAVTGPFRTLRDTYHGRVLSGFTWVESPVLLEPLTIIQPTSTGRLRGGEKEMAGVPPHGHRQRLPAGLSENGSHLELLLQSSSRKSWGAGVLGP